MCWFFVRIGTTIALTHSNRHPSSRCHQYPIYTLRFDLICCGNQNTAALKSNTHPNTPPPSTAQQPRTFAIINIYFLTPWRAGFLCELRNISAAKKSGCRCRHKCITNFVRSGVAEHVGEKLGGGCCIRRVQKPNSSFAKQCRVHLAHSQVCVDRALCEQQTAYELEYIIHTLHTHPHTHKHAQNEKIVIQLAECTRTAPPARPQRHFG